MSAPCFTGVPNGTGGCDFVYQCPDPQSVCIRNAGQDVCAGLNPMVACQRLIVRTRVFLVCSNVPQGWFDSTNACDPANTGFGLASIRTAEEHDALGQLLNTGRYWIGLTDRSENNISTEGTYVWQDGTALFFGRTLGQSPWCAGQPSAATADEDCIALDTTGDCWTDEVCTNPAQPDGTQRVTGFVCGR